MCNYFEVLKIKLNFKVILKIREKKIKKYLIKSKNIKNH